ncbi:MAG: 2-C-methyl-D-erythritol 4-phosphate cytidylyltransferase [Gemmatimonadota bacterium]
MPRDVGVVIVAGGSAQRMGGATPKQFLPVRGVPMLLWTLRPFTSHPDVVNVTVVVPAGIDSALPAWLSDLVEAGLRVVAGGAERMDSVENGLRALPEDCAVVLVHDAARPFVSREVIDGVITYARAGDGAIAALPVRDTLKASRTSGVDAVIAETVPRDTIWRAQTPQGFPRPLLERAFQQARADGASATDEASLVERLNHKIHLVMDSSWNIKITTPEDLRLAELIAGDLV